MILYITGYITYIWLSKGYTEMFWLYKICYVTNFVLVGLGVCLCLVCLKMSASANWKDMGIGQE